MKYKKETPGWPEKTHPSAIKLLVNPSTNAKTGKENLTTKIEWALYYAQMGWPVFPVHSIQNGWCTCRKSDCESPGKHPRTYHGHSDATTDTKQIKKWWDKWPSANIGIATGKISGIVVLDIDKKPGGFESLKKLEEEYGKLPETLTANTGGGGSHFYFKYPESGFKSTGGVLGTGIDTRGDGGYIIAHPSNHLSGNNYQWAKNKPGDIELAELPNWVSEQLESSGNALPIGRHQHLTSFAGTLRHRLPGLTLSDLTLALIEENEKECKPPLDDVEVRRIAGCIFRYRINRPLNDAGNAERLVDRYGEDLMFCPEWKKWLIWNGSYWEIDIKNQIRGYAIDTARNIVNEVENNEGDE